MLSSQLYYKTTLTAKFSAYTCRRITELLSRQACLTFNASAPVLLRALYFFLGSSPCTPTFEPLIANLSNSLSLQMTNSSGSSRVEMNLPIGGRWQFPWNHHLPGPKVWAKHQLTNQEGTAEDVLPASVEKNTSCQSQWWCSFTPPSFNLSSLPPSPSGTLLPLPSTKADCSVSSAALKRWLAAILYTLQDTESGKEDCCRMLWSITTNTSRHKDSFFPLLCWIT